MCVCVYVRACVRACVCVRVCVCLFVSAKQPGINRQAGKSLNFKLDRALVVAARAHDRGFSSLIDLNLVKNFSVCSAAALERCDCNSSTLYKRFALAALASLAAAVAAAAAAAAAADFS